MKSLVLSLAIGFSTLICGVTRASVPQAAFLPNSVLPVALQEMIITEIKTRCPKLNQWGTEMAEISTGTSLVIDSSGSAHTLFTTAFSLRYIFDGMHPISSSLEVTSVGNGTFDANGIRAPFAVQSVSSEACD